MFRRKDSEDSLFGSELTEETDSFSVQPAANNDPLPVPASLSTVVAPPSASVQPITRPASVPPAASSFRPNAPLPAAPASTTNTITSPTTRTSEVKPMNPIANPNSSQSSNKVNNRVLTVGNDILLKGEINSCDRLVIEGKVEATVSDVNTLELAECGSFKGSANVVDAQISGLFEGDLVVTGRLVIYASGKVRGNITYGEIEIERGGELTGQIKAAGSSSASSMPKALQKAAA